MADTAEAPARNSLYDTDFYEWTQEQDRLLRKNRWQDLDLDKSLRRLPADRLERFHDSARLKAADETGIAFTLFPETCSFTIEQIRDEGFLPLEPDLYAFGDGPR